MKKNKSLMKFVAAGTLIWGLTEGTLSLRAMMNTYSNACGPLDGIPGLLQKTGFVPVGQCKKVKVDGTVRCAEEACDYHGHRGHCARDRAIVKELVCVCKAGKLSE